MLARASHGERDGAMKLPASRFDGQDRTDRSTLFKDLFSVRVLDGRHTQSDADGFY